MDTSICGRGSNSEPDHLTLFVNKSVDKLRILLGSKVPSTKENLEKKFSISLDFNHHPQIFSEEAVTLIDLYVIEK